LWGFGGRRALRTFPPIKHHALMQMSNIRFQESNGKLTLSLSKSDPKWGTLNDQIKSQTKGAWNENLSCWDIPKSEINIVKNILNKVTDDANDDSSGDEGYTTDDGGADDVLSTALPPPRATSRTSKTSRTSQVSRISRTSRNSRDGAVRDEDIIDTIYTIDDDEIPIVKSRAESRDRNHSRRAESHDVDRGASRASRASRTSAQSEDNVFDYITDDSRHHKLKKILKIRGFLYYLKCNLPKNEFRYLLRVGDITG
jgi:hypothetical protein